MDKKGSQKRYPGQRECAGYLFNKEKILRFFAPHAVCFFLKFFNGYDKALMLSLADQIFSVGDSEGKYQATAGDLCQHALAGDSGAEGRRGVVREV